MPADQAPKSWCFANLDRVSFEETLFCCQLVNSFPSLSAWHHHCGPGFAARPPNWVVKLSITTQSQCGNACIPCRKVHFASALTSNSQLRSNSSLSKQARTKEIPNCFGRKWGYQSLICSLMHKDELLPVLELQWNIMNWITWIRIS